MKQSLNHLIQQAFRMAQDPCALPETLSLLNRLELQASQTMRSKPDQEDINDMQSLWEAQSLQVLLSHLADLGNQDQDQKTLLCLRVIVPMIRRLLTR